MRRIAAARVPGCRGWLLLTPVLLCGCGSDRGDPAADVGFVLRDSAGIAIIETPGRLADVEMGWRVGDVPEIQIGRMEGERPYLFSRIGGVIQLRGGRIVVADGGSREIRYFDSAGEFLYRFGGIGEGPGEFMAAPRLIPTAGRDSLVVFAARISVFGHDGEVRRVRSRPEIPPTRVERHGRQMTLRRLGGLVGFAGERVLGLRGMSFLGQPGETQPPDQREVLLLDLGSMETTSLGVHDGPQYFVTEANELGQTGAFLVPFHAELLAATDGEHVYLIPDRDPEVRVYDSRGELQRIIRLLESANPVTPEELTAFIEEQKVEAPSEIVASMYDRWYRDVRLPEVMPSFRSLLVDDLGWIWAERYSFRSSTPSTWTVFDPDGRARGTVRLPADLDVSQIGEDFVLGTWRDEFSVEYVGRYDLDRGH